MGTLRQHVFKWGRAEDVAQYAILRADAAATANRATRPYERAEPQGGTVLGRVVRFPTPYPVALLLALLVLGRGHAQQTAAPLPATQSLRAHLFALADDSMQGRLAATPGYDRAVRYVVAVARELHLVPAGDSGRYTQTIPRVERYLSPDTRLAVESTQLRPGTDFRPLVLGRGEPRPLDGARAVLGGTHGDTASYFRSDSLSGRVVLLRPPRRQEDVWRQLSFGGDHPFQRANAVFIASLDMLAPEQRAPAAGVALLDETDRPAASAPAVVLVSRDAARVLLGISLDSAPPGTVGQSISGQLLYSERATPTPNVLALIPGSDPQVNREYVILGAHLDHLGVASLGGADSIFNGADDNASGSSVLLAVAEVLARQRHRLRRSVLLVWFTAEEGAMLGSRWLAAHLPVPAESVVAFINLDMVGRRNAGADGRPLLHVIEPSDQQLRLDSLTLRLAATAAPLLAPDTRDPDGSLWRSDQISFMPHGVPVLLLTTGQHPDYHRITDDATRVDLSVLSSVTALMTTLTLAVASDSAYAPGARH